MLRRVWSFLLLAALFTPSAARASQTTIGIALNGTHGTHRESDGTATAPLIPAPVLSVWHRSKRFEIAAEGLPPIGPIGVSNNGLGMRDISLTYADATLRYWNRAQTLAFGFGETLYNQRTNFLVFAGRFGQAYDINRSRIAGTRYEILGRFHVNLRTFVEAQLGVDPALHGRFTFTHRFVPVTGRGFEYTQPPSWERASQVDANLRFVHEYGPYALSYGVRYLNYTAAFTGRAGSPFADANSLLMPYIGFERAWGR